MSVRIIIPSFLQHITNDEKIALVNATEIGECLNEFVKRFPSTRKLLFNEHGKLHEYIEVYLNGASTYPEELSRPVNDGDEIDIMFVIAGG